MMKELDIISISKSDFRNVLKTLTRFFTFGQTGSGGFLLSNINESLKDISFPDKVPDGGDLYIDFPMKYPVYAKVMPFNNIYDLFTQIKDIIECIFSNRRIFQISEYIKFNDLYIEKLTVCTNGDIIVYIKTLEK